MQCIVRICFTLSYSCCLPPALLEGLLTHCLRTGLRLLSGSTTDATEASALGYKTDHIHIYSNSWGPFDNGFLVEGPGPLLKAVLETGVKTVRTALHSSADVVLCSCAGS